MKRAQFLLVAGVLLLFVGLCLTGVSPGLAQEPSATQEAPPPGDALGQPPSFLLKYYEAWVGSPHAKADAEAFVHWNKEGKIPADCATCHSTPGYLDKLGEDGSAPDKVDAEAPIGTVINCDACHNNTASNLTTVSFPSGAVVGDMGDSTRCIVCHQGRSSTVQVNAALEKAGLNKDLDKPSPDLRFLNIHYYAAAASMYGSEAHGGYEYEGKAYQVRYRHVEGYNTCASCHNSHTLELRVEACSTCHKDVKTVEDLRAIRMPGSQVDYDGDGDVEEGLAAEITGLQEVLYTTIQSYASEVLKAPITYNSAAYPYFFADPNANGKVDEGEAIPDNAYKSFTARLVQAAYNYQMSIKDPGNYAHNASYHIELLYDSIESLNSQLGDKGANLTLIVRNNPGHFDTTTEAFRHWDAEGVVPGTCAKCHTAQGLPVFLANNANVGIKPSESLACTTCHDKLGEFTTYTVKEVTFPSGAVLSMGENEPDNLCLNCHQGRESTVSVNRVITASGVGPDEVSEKLTFRNVHYFAAGASLFGTQAKGAYEYEGKEYSGRNEHVKRFDTCNDCHDTHVLKVNFEDCTDCHEGAKTTADIRAEEDDVDYDGDGDVKEPITAEIDTLKQALLEQIYAYATKTAGASIVYDSHSHPYWFIDTNANGKVDEGEAKGDNRFVKWTPNLLRAAYNYQYVSKDPGSYAHNPSYVLQVLYDSLESVGGKQAVAKFKRAEVKAAPAE
jgi:hypothetical protein